MSFFERYRKLFRSIFKIAAGTYERIKTIFEKHPTAAASSDFGSDVLTMFINLMLAQSQELFLNLVSSASNIIRLFFLLPFAYFSSLISQAARNNMQPGAISKLAAQAAEYYNSSLEIMNRDNINKLCFSGFYVCIFAFAFAFLLFLTTFEHKASAFFF